MNSLATKKRLFYADNKYNEYETGGKITPIHQ